MSYDEKLELVRTSLISYCKECIIGKWGGRDFFGMWLKYDADMDFGYGYQNKFNEQFSQYMNSEIKDVLWLAGKHMVYAISAFMAYKNNADLDDVLDFTEKFLSEQLDDFDNLSDYIAQAMYQETSDEDEPS